jgi:hypothetical protein
MNNPLKDLVQRAYQEPLNGRPAPITDHYAHQDPYGHDMPRVVRQTTNPTPLHPHITPEQQRVESEITNECANLAALLINKNRQYGNSALNPLRVFSRAPSAEQILVRIDDKLSRIRTGAPSSDQEDTVQDLLGYLILLRLAQRGVM